MDLEELRVIENFIWLIPLFPALGFVINGLFGHFLSRKVVGRIACGSVFLSLVMSFLSFLALVGMPVGDRVLHCRCFQWIKVGHISLDIGFLIDPLGAVMILVVAGVGFLIHVYSIGYMAHDKSVARFFTYMNLFTFMMLTLVTGESILLMFVGWEGVGLCSYLLIGFWYESHANADAGKKAFVVNRIGDFGFLIGIFVLFWSLGKISGGKVWTLNFADLAAHIHLLKDVTLGHAIGIGMFGLGSMSVLNFVGICFFIGAAGKSAQIPLYVWLPDAMAGPTPVSALIHAATMVTAGVYMIARLNFLYTLAPLALTVVAFVAGVTAFMSAIIGLAQNDIKRVLAYSTVSQLGYMFLAMGAGAYAAGIFHLMTHAFFKACLFLGAGSVIHAMSDEQDMRAMGGLKKWMPVTHWTMLASTVALAGWPLTAGFFSKDEILWKIFESHKVNMWHLIPWALGVAGAFLTAFYMFRLMVLTFYGECRADEHVKSHLHESPPVMIWPLRILGALALVGGFIGVPYAMSRGLFPNFFEEWLHPVMSGTLYGTPAVEHGLQGHGGSGAAGAHHHVEAVEYLLMGMSIIIALGGSAISYFIYTRRQEIIEQFVQKFSNLHRWVYNKYYVDELYEYVFVDGAKRLMRILAWFDLHIIDGIVDFTGRALVWITALSGKIDYDGVDGTVRWIGNETIRLGSITKLIQSGRVQYYLMIAMGILVGIVLLFQFMG
ncbi:NADH-quinone oxidoreductase subunit L [candidate division CSSED10-310 bacterium]|uniref:NADH-quinone oxidoreductase subunit L n=1 Tax=candidate division CSSED10-310 bacterium TaxID=2855610 RepID=A0ABV6Z360_UNCC1